MSMEGFACRQCGQCCLNYNGYKSCATEKDVALWKKNGRNDILQRVVEVGPGVFEIRVHPENGEDVSHCPWLYKLPRQEKYICLIQELKPKICREYPVTREHAEETGCPGYK